MGDVARAIWTDRLHEMIRVAAGHEEQVPVVHERRNELLGGAVDDPVLNAAIGVIACHALAAGQYHLVASVDLANNRRTVAPGLVGPLILPEGLPSTAVECDKIPWAVMVTIDDQLIAPQDRTGAIAMDACKHTGMDGPEQVACEVIRSDEHPVAVEETDIDPLAISGGGRRCMAVQ